MELSPEATLLLVSLESIFIGFQLVFRNHMSLFVLFVLFTTLNDFNILKHMRAYPDTYDKTRSFKNSLHGKLTTWVHRGKSGWELPASLFPTIFYILLIVKSFNYLDSLILGIGDLSDILINNLYLGTYIAILFVVVSQKMFFYSIRDFVLSDKELYGEDYGNN